ncbi:MAG: SpoIID/LytB domain-containing protein [Clostridiales bacterium]|nr:SpoIID/LytB domain-containing protein [Clostridiales bacterium]
MKRVLFIILTALIFFGCGKAGDMEKTEPSETAETGIYGDSLPVTRGEAGRMLALCLYEYNEIISLEDKAAFSDIGAENPLYKYVNAVYTAGLMAGDGVNFRAEDYLTVGEAEAVINAADKSGRLKIEADEGTEKNPISYYIWLQILGKLSEAGVFEGIACKEMTVLMTGMSSEEIRGYVLCEEGIYKSDDFVPEKLENTQTEFMVRGNVIIGISSVVSDSPVFEGCLVLSCSGGEAVIFYGGCKKTFKTDAETESEPPFIADVTVKGSTLLGLERYTTEKYGRVIAAGESILFDDDYSYAADENIRVYSTYDGVKVGGAEDIISGSYSRIVFKDNRAVCALCEEGPDEDIIRIALSGSEGSLVHKSVDISSAGDFTLKSGSKENEYEGGSSLKIGAESQTELFGGKKISLSPKAGGKINVNGKEYPGRIDVISCDGGYNVVCETNLNSYLYGVVCGEMPASYGEEALKAQALAARSYAYNQRQGNKRLSFGANIDDTTAFQIYDPNSVCDEAVKAVDETDGEMIMYKGSVINACFYSTSCGIGANSGDVWTEGSSVTPEYLKSSPIGDISVPDFSDEEQALSFFKLIEDGGLEADCPCYRWSFRADKNSFKTKAGAVEAVTVTKRGEGGNVTEVLVEGENEDVVVSGESNIRNLLAPGEIKLNDGTVKQFSSLPSSFFAVEIVEGEIYFYGGGFGHGVGMSQNGAKALADSGKGYTEITEYFYKGTTIGKP